MFFPKLRNLLILLIIIVFSTTCLLTGYASPLQQTIKNTENELARIQQNLDGRGKVLAEYQNEEKKLEGELSQLEKSLAALRRELTQVEAQIVETETNIQITEQELAEAERQIERKDDLLKRRLRAMHENGETGYLEVLFNAYSFAEFLTRLNDLTIIAENDFDLLEQAYLERLAIQEVKDKLEGERAGLLDLKVQRLNRREDINKQLADREKLLGDLQKNIDATEKAIKELENEAQKVEDMIKKLQEEMRRQTERFNSSGKLLWPLAEYGTSWITSGYGTRVNPITRKPGEFHGAIDIGIPRTRWPASSNYNGNPVYIRASDSGVVIFAGISGSLTYGYGRLIIISHGKGPDGKELATVYAHCHSLLVAPGQEVARGQNIGIVGSTGSSTGPHLHYEVRVDGVRQNPMSSF
ncbi:MAG: peptidoglycan DD-metalloendopeptidase family protein [Bacillota bacterium]|nr:peptidoglycan DD-metalloendopeptidase family protein [Bacillota bacterium]